MSETIDILEQADIWRRAGETVAIATVVQTWGSAPVPVGGRMILTQSGKMAGSISGGCIEAAVIDAAAEILATGKARLLQYGVTNERAWEVGLACGGQVSLFVERVG